MPEKRAQRMRILGVDPGGRRIGLAVSDELGIIARGIDTFDIAAGVDFLVYVSGLVGSYGIGEIVVGDPVHLSGRVGESSEKARALAAKLQSRFKLPVTLWDERLSSEEARRVLRGSKPNKGVVDKLAAVIILQSYLDYRRKEA
ncbi:MAG: Holliday junction resolvase RuvX [Candidatus Krumholzibacteriia bacterium]